MSSTIQKLVPVGILMLIVGGCMSDAERGLYKKVTVTCKIVAVNPTQYRWDVIVVEFPSGERFRVRVSRGMYQLGGAYSQRMWKWEAIERGAINP